MVANATPASTRVRNVVYWPRSVIVSPPHRGCLYSLAVATRICRMDLSDHECAVLDFERESWMLPGRKDDEIRARLAISSSSYYRTLHALIERPEAFSYDPLTVLRLRRRRGDARRGRIEGPRADPRSR